MQRNNDFLYCARRWFTRMRANLYLLLLLLYVFLCCFCSSSREVSSFSTFPLLFSVVFIYFVRFFVTMYQRIADSTGKSVLA